MNETSREDFISSVFLLLLHHIIPLSFYSINHSRSSSKITSLSNSLMSFFQLQSREHSGYNTDPGTRSGFSLLSSAYFCLWLQIPFTPACGPQFPVLSSHKAGELQVDFQQLHLFFQEMSLWSALETLEWPDGHCWVPAPGKCNLDTAPIP